MLTRTVSVTEGGRPEIIGHDDEGRPLVQLVYELEVHDAELDRLPRTASAWSVRPRQITELGLEWYVIGTRLGTLAPGAELLPGEPFGGPRIWDPAAQSWHELFGFLFAPREATDPPAPWEAAAQPLSVSSSGGVATATVDVPISMLPHDRWVHIAVRSRFRIEKPRRFRGMIGFGPLQIIGAISDTQAPTLSLGSPFGSTLSSPIVISGYAVDRDLHGSGATEISKVEYEIHDIGLPDARAFDFGSQRWTDPDDASAKEIDQLVPIIGPGGVTFEERWRIHYAAATSGHFELVVRAFDESGNVASVHHEFDVDEQDPTIRFDAPRPRQTVAGPLVAVDGTIADTSEISRVRMSVASSSTNSTPRYLASDGQWVDSVVDFEPTIETSGNDQTFSWSWSTPSETTHYSVVVEATDAAGNVSRARHSFASMPIDTEAPLAQVRSPRHGTEVSGSVRVRARAMDRVQLSETRVEVWRVDNDTDEMLHRVFDEPASSAGPGQWKYFELTVDFDPIVATSGPGRYAIAAVAIDGVGHEERDLHIVTIPA